MGVVDARSLQDPLLECLGIDRDCRGKHVAQSWEGETAVRAYRRYGCHSTPDPLLVFGSKLSPSLLEWRN